jgi:DNA-binding FadR family transcriptional regulator
MTNRRQPPPRRATSNRRGLAASAVEDLLAQIASGRLKPGDRLPPEPEAAARFGVSRPTMRQALKTLEAAGVLESRPRRGTVLARSSPGSLGPLFGAHLTLAGIPLRAVAEARAVLEGGMARLAARNRKARDLKELGAALAELEEAGSGTEAYLSAEKRFHGAVVVAAGNPVLSALRDVLSLYFEKSWPRARRKASPRRHAAIQREHRRIYEAIRGRQAEDAAGLIARHLAPTLRPDAARGRTAQKGGWKGNARARIGSSAVPLGRKRDDSG